MNSKLKWSHDLKIIELELHTKVPATLLNMKLNYGTCQHHIGSTTLINNRKRSKEICVKVNMIIALPLLDYN